MHNSSPHYFKASGQHKVTSQQSVVATANTNVVQRLCLPQRNKYEHDLNACASKTAAPSMPIQLLHTSPTHGSNESILVYKLGLKPKGSSSMLDEAFGSLPQMMLPMQEQLSNSVDSKCTVLGSQVATGNSTCSPVQSMSLRLALENEWILKGEKWRLLQWCQRHSCLKG